MKTLYVAGFLFTPLGSSVLLVLKNRPAWQAGNWNGIGGHVEGSETSDAAMRREFLEETSIDVQNWEKFCIEEGTDYAVHFYRSTLDSGAWTGRLPPVPDHNDSGERLSWHNSNLRGADVIGNLRWVVPLALDWRRWDTPPLFITRDNIVERASW